MQYIEGETLAARMKHGALSYDEVLSISIQIADALSTAHARNIIHRDIKPANLILTRRGDLKVLDFGLAKVLFSPTGSVTKAETKSLLTQPGLIVGTVPYMSPEQVRSQEVDARSDIWSLGVVLYEMITHHVPFSGESHPDTLSAILSRDPPPLTRYTSAVPAELQRIVGKMLRKNRDERYQTAKDVMIDLQDLRKQLESSSRPDSSRAVEAKFASTTGVETDHQTESDKAVFTKGRVLIASLSVLLIAASLFVYWRVTRIQQVREKSGLQGVTQVTTWSGLDIYPSLSPDGNAIVYSSDHNGSFEVYVRPITAGARETQITNDGQANFQPAWSPDGQRIAYCSKKRGGIWLVPASGGNAKQVSQFGSSPAWSHDGTLLAFQSDPLTALGAQAAPSQPPSIIWIVPVNGSVEPTPVTQVGHPAGGHGAPSWSPDGKHIVICVSDFGSSSIWTVARDGSAATKIANYGYDPVYAPDGKSIYYTTLSGIWKAQVSPTTGGPIAEPIQLSSSSSERIRNFVISSDGKKAVYSALLTNSNLWYVPLSPASSTPTGPPISLTHDKSFRNSIPIFSPDGKRIAFNTQKTNRDRAEGDIWVMDADGKNVTQVTTEGGGMASWFPGGEQLAFLTYRNPRTAWSVNLQTWQDKPLSWDFGEDVNYMRLSPDGKQILYNSKRSGTTNTWKIPIAGGQPGQLTFDDELMGFACWSPDGKTLGVQIKRGGDTNLAVMPSDGGPVTQLTFDNGQSWLSGFSPDGDKLVFAGFRDGLWNIWWVSRSLKSKRN
jgi:Tol biopolymer transport system component